MVKRPFSESRKALSKAALVVAALLAVCPTMVLALNVEMQEPKNKRMAILAGAEPVVISFRVEGRQLQFQWNLIGPGQLDGATERSNTALYVPPKNVDSAGATAIVSFSVADYEDNQFNDSVIFTISGESSGQAASGTSPRPAKTKAEDLNVRIVEPLDGGEVPGAARVSGTCDESVQDDIWVFVWPEKAPGRGWPQSDDGAAGRSALKKGGEWSTLCHFGGPPQSYEIAVYTADAKATAFIAEKLVKWTETGRHEGIMDVYLPAGLVERHRVRVTKRQ